MLYVFMYVVNKNDYAEYDAEQSSENTEDDAQEEDDVQEENILVEEKEDLSKTWGIHMTSRKKLDYHRVLLEEDYGWFAGNEQDDGMDEMFSFAYPKGLFYEVDAQKTGEDYYGLFFRGKGNKAFLSFTQEAMDARNTSSEEISSRYEEDKALLSETNTIYHSSSLYVIDGYEEENLEVYKVVRFNENHIYTMTIKTPVPENEDERTLVSYYTEYMYRSCGFSGSTRTPRSYSKYLLGIE